MSRYRSVASALVRQAVVPVRQALVPVRQALAPVHQALAPVHQAMAIGASVVLCVGLAGCGLSVDDAAESVDPPAFWETASTSTTVSAAEDTIFELTLYWIANAETGPLLIRVDRPSEDAPGISDALAALVEGPSEQTGAAVPTLRTFLTAQFDPQVEAAPDDGLLVVRVADEAGFRDEPRAELFQQLVCTLTEPSLTNGAVDRVRVVDSQGRIPPTNYNLETLEGDGTRADYGDCVATTDVSEILPDDSSTTSSG